jgi:class 3 adenylate cyclase
MTYPVPDNEKARLDVLDEYDVVGTPPELNFDEIAEMAGQICNCPVAVVNIVADRWEWYKGKCGIPENIDKEPRGGLCSTMICLSDMLVVADLSMDKRFAQQAMVTGEPYFRFYAGMPLINPEGYALGSLCVLDYKPREIDSRQAEALRCLTRQAVAQLELRRKVAALEETRRALAEEKRKSDELLLNILPADIAAELKDHGKVRPRFYDSVTTLFSDFKGFTGLTERSEPRAVVDALNQYFSAFDDIVARRGLEKLKTIGDAYMCAGGVPDRNHSHAVDCCLAALDMQAYMAAANEQREKMGLPRWDLRIGIHTGPVMAGVVGKRKFTYDIWGDGVNVASLMETLSEPGRITISESTRQRVEDHVETEYRGEIETAKKGVLRTYFLHGQKPPGPDK